MRPLEVLLLAAAAALILATTLLRGRPAWQSILAVILLIILSAQLALEGWRPPMLALYAVIGLGLLCFALARNRPELRAGFGAALGLLTVLALAALYAGYLRPVFTLPPASGPFAIGWLELPLDEHDVDGATVGAEMAPPRVRLWYPAAPSAHPASLIEWLTQPPRPDDTTSGQRDARPAPLEHAAPVIVYLPGWSGTDLDNRVMVRELVSHGFAVATIEYPQQLPGMSAPRRRAIVRELERYPTYASEAVYRSAVAQSIARVRKRTHDASRVLDALHAFKQSVAGDSFAVSLDPDRAGLLGFSLGGAIAAQTAWDDARFKAAVNMDGRHWADGREHGVRQPYLFISEPLLMPSDTDMNSSNADLRYNAREDHDDYTRGRQNLESNGGLHITLAGTAHLNFSDIGLSSPLRRYTGGGQIDPHRAIEIVSTYLLAFFGRTLRDEDQPLLDGDSSQYPDVQVEVFAKPASR